METLEKWFSKEYKLLLVKVYFNVLRSIFFSKAFFLPYVGIFYRLKKNKKKQREAFLKGSAIWGLLVVKTTKTKLIRVNEIDVPQTGHLIFVNHINEMDFPFDSIVINRPYLANQVIKKTIFAYAWMRAMGSQVFDAKKARTIAESVKNLMHDINFHSFIVYPEGRNTYGEQVQPLKKGMIKIAFDNKIPIYVIIKSGISKFQNQSKGNTIGYKSLGKFNPWDFETWESLQSEIQNLMIIEKIKLDKEMEELESFKEI